MILFVFAFAAALAGSSSAKVPAAPASKPPNIILIIVDDLRADRLGAYGGGARVSPNFDAMAGRGALFLDAFSQAGWTLPSVSSIMTGLYPTTHGVHRALPRDWRSRGDSIALRPGSILSKSLTTLAAALRQRGYWTEAIISSGFGHPIFGFGNGFDRYSNSGGSFADLNGEILQRLPGPEASKPFFLYVHIMDVHQDDMGDHGVLADPAQRQRALEAYDREIQAADAGFGMLQEILRAKGQLDRTIIVVTADHGEEFGEHEAYGHGDSAYDSALHVPLMIQAPGDSRARRVSGPVQSIDILPTLLDLAGLPPLTGVQGVSLKPLMRGERAGASTRAAYSEIYPHEPPDNDKISAVAVRMPEWKYIWRPDGRDELYLIKEDPGESHDLALTRPEVLRDFRARTEAWRSGLGRAPSGRVLSDGAENLPPEQAERLRWMGYLGSSAPQQPEPGSNRTAVPAPAPDQGGAENAERMKFKSLYGKARSLLAAERFDEARAVIAQLDPPADAQGSELLEMLRERRDLKKQVGDFAGAEADQRAALPAQRAFAFLQHAQVNHLLRDAAGEEADLRAALEASPADPSALEAIARFQLGSREPKEALAYADRLLAALNNASPAQRAAAFCLRAQMRLELNDGPGAENDIKQALKLGPVDPGALRSSAQIELAVRKPKEALADANRLVGALADVASAERAAAYSQRAAIRLELKDDAGAESDLKQALELVPDDVEILQSLVQLKLDAGRPKDALAYANRLVDSQAQASPARRAAAYRRRAQIRLALGAEAEAESDLKRVLELAPEDPEALQSLARLKLPQREPKQTLEYANRLVAALAAAPPARRAAAYSQRAAIRLELKDDPGAQDDLKRALALAPDDSAALQSLAQLKLNLREPKAALAYANRLVGALEKASPAPRAQAYGQRAAIRLELKDEAGAESDLKLALELVPDDAEILQSLVQLKLDAGRPKDALAYANRLVDSQAQASPARRAAAYRRRAQIRLALGAEAEAESDLKRVLELAPEDPEALQSLARLKLPQREPKQTLEYANRLVAALAAAPPARRAAAYSQRAAIRLELKDEVGAEDDLKETLELAPGDGLALRSMSRLNFLSQRPEEALGYANRLVAALAAASPAERAAAYRGRAQIRLELKDEAGAESDLKLALELVPDDAEILQSLVQLKLDAGRPKDALAYANRFVDSQAQASPARRAAAYRRRAQIRLALGAEAEAESDLKRVLELAPEDPEALQSLARLKLPQREPKQTLAYASRLVAALAAASPARRAAAYRERAQIRLELKDDPGAQDDLKQALALAPDDSAALQSLAQLKLNLREPKAALAYADRLVGALEKAGPAERAQAHRQRAAIRLELKDEAGAESDLEQALDIVADDLDAMELLVQVKRRRPREAAAVVAKHWPSDPRPPARWLALRALTRMLAKDPAAAQADLEAAGRIDPAAVCSNPIFGTERDRLDLSYFELCLRWFPKDPALFADRGIARYRRGQSDLAVADFRRAIEMKPDFPEASLSLASVLVEQGRHAEALAAVNLALAKAASRRGAVFDELISLRASLGGAGVDAADPAR